MRGHLVLWDIDHTLINAGGLSHHLYGVVFGADAKLLEGIQVGDQVQGKLEKRDTGNVIIKLEKR